MLADVDAWFERNVFGPLRGHNADGAIAAMWDAVDVYFQSGGRICLVGAFALDDTRDRFAEAITGYFQRWTEASRDAFIRSGRDAATATSDAEDVVLGIQGALVLARATGDRSVFARSIRRRRARVANPARR